MKFLKNLFNFRKEKPITTYQEFWDWFQKKEKTFYKVVKKHDKVDEEALSPIMAKLQQLNEQFYCQLGMSDDNTADLVITAESDVKNFVFVDEFLAAAPKIEGWMFTNLKPASGVGVTIGMGGYKFGQETIQFYENILPEYPDEIDITLVHKDFNEDNKKTIVTGSLIYLDTILGEYAAATMIDSVDVKGRAAKGKALVPMEKLKDFLIWREKEFIEKYRGKRQSKDDDMYAICEAETEDGDRFIAAINTSLLAWDAQPSHPWMMVIETEYDGAQNNGLPNTDTYQLMLKFEEFLIEGSKNTEGVLYLGRQTGKGSKKLYFACKEFKKSSKMAFELIEKHKDGMSTTYDIYKDKYWMTMNRFKQV
jgi:hypothetical protein